MKGRASAASAGELSEHLDAIRSGSNTKNNSMSWDSPGMQSRTSRMSDEDRVLSELAHIVNSKAYRSRGPSRNLSMSLPPGVVPDASTDIELDPTRATSGVDKVAALGHTEQHLDPSTDLIELTALGEGAFAVVNLCKTTKRSAFPKGSYAARTGLVACKRLKPECIAEEPLEFDNFMTEAALVKTLVHRNVIECYGCIEYREKESGMHCVMILLEYLQGGSLRSRIAKKDYTGAQAVRWLVEIADGMSYLHAVANIGVAHRDLKPDNILLDEHGVAKIADMGMARIAMRAPSGEINHVDFEENYSSSLQKNSSAKLEVPSDFSVTCRTGTPRYMAPENWAGTSYTYKVDVFSFAILAYEVLSGQRAYGELMMNGQALADAVAETGLRPTVPAAWPPALTDLLVQCWAEDPEARPDFETIAVKLRLFQEAAFKDPSLVASLVGGHRKQSSGAHNPTFAQSHGAVKAPAEAAAAKEAPAPPVLEQSKKKKGQKSSSMCVIS